VVNTCKNHGFWLNFSLTIRDLRFSSSRLIISGNKRGIPSHGGLHFGIGMPNIRVDFTSKVSRWPQSNFSLFQRKKRESDLINWTKHRHYHSKPSNMTGNLGTFGNLPKADQVALAGPNLWCLDYAWIIPLFLLKRIHVSTHHVDALKEDWTWNCPKLGWSVIHHPFTIAIEHPS